MIVIGKGAAYARAEKECQELIELTQFPFLPTPMGKGVVRDDHPLSIAPARSLAIKQVPARSVVFRWLGVILCQ